MLPPQKVILIGPMGAGKSTIGCLLARYLSLPFKDSDTEIEGRTGANIRWIFDVEGEEGFRRREMVVLSDLLKLKRLVLATGGGIVLQAENRHLLLQENEVIYLSTTPEQLMKRTQKTKNRPLLDVPNPQHQIQKLLSERDPLYRQVATKVVATDTRKPEAVAQAIAMSILNR
ncbi:MAG: shikimate kinase [Cellvibrionaceae bacterium]|jgi:shikimate kinase